MHTMNRRLQATATMRFRNDTSGRCNGRRVLLTLAVPRAREKVNTATDHTHSDNRALVITHKWFCFCQSYFNSTKYPKLK